MLGFHMGHYPYYVFGAICSITALFGFTKTSSSRHLGLYLTFVGFFSLLFYGLRWQSGADYEAYTRIYDLMPSFQNFSYHEFNNAYGDPGFKLLATLVKSIGVSNIFFMAFLSFLSLIIKIWISRKIGWGASVALILYMLLYGINYEFIQIRYAIAIGFVLASIYYLICHKTKLFLLFLSLAASFHIFSFVFLAAICGRRVRLPATWLVLLSIFVAFIFASFSELIINYSFAILGHSDYLLSRAGGYVADVENYGKPIEITSFLVLRIYFLSLVVSFWCRPHTPFLAEMRRVSFFLLLVGSSFAWNSIMFSRFFVVVEYLLLIQLLEYVLSMRRKGNRSIISLAAIVLSGMFYSASLNSTNIYSYQTWINSGTL